MAVLRTARKKPLPKRSRTWPVFGRGDDAGRYFRCWNCGFVCDSKRDQLGGANSAGGDNHQDAALQAGASYRAGIGLRPVGTLDVIDHYQTALKATYPGSNEAKAVYHHHKTNITAGCPFCGSTNYRGDY
jgi:hypothetical protein